MLCSPPDPHAAHQTHDVDTPCDACYTANGYILTLSGGTASDLGLLGVANDGVPSDRLRALSARATFSPNTIAGGRHLGRWCGIPCIPSGWAMHSRPLRPVPCGNRERASGHRPGPAPVPLGPRWLSCLPVVSIRAGTRLARSSLALGQVCWTMPSCASCRAAPARKVLTHQRLRPRSWAALLPPRQVGHRLAAASRPSPAGPVIRADARRPSGLRVKAWLAAARRHREEVIDTTKRRSHNYRHA